LGKAFRSGGGFSGEAAADRLSGMGEKAKPLPTWRVSAIHKKAQYITSVFAPTTEAAAKAVIEDYGIKDPNRQRWLIAIRET